MTEGLIFYANVSDKTHGEGATFAARHMNDEKLTPSFSPYPLLFTKIYIALIFNY